MLKVAVIEGGYSNEKAVSIKSAHTVFENLDREKYVPTKVLIDEKEWTAYDNEGRYPIDKNDFSFTKNNTKNTFDVAFIVIHGSPGEDGKLQGYFDLIGIPYTTPSQMITALTFEKFHCNQFLKNFGLNVAEAVLIKKNDTISSNSIIDKVGLPCFVKPTDGGSSFGISKVTAGKELESAIELAFKHGSQVIIEEFIEGRELTNGVFRSKNEIKVLPVTEIITENEFFDYAAKYNGESIEVTPADIDSALTKKIKTLTKRIYDILNLKGIARIDYIVTSKGSLYIIEINTVPGQSAESIIPQMAEVEGIGLKEFFGEVVQSILKY
jgi:D-alanine-D-alanine ligase